MIVTAGKTNVSVYYYIVGDAGHATPGEPVTGLLYSDIETGGSASYARQGAARVDLTLITLASASAAHSDGGFILVDDTNMPGVYRCDYADAAFATGVDQVFLSIVVASAKNAVAAPIMVDITDVNLRDSVRGGMTSLPNAAADGAGGLAISDAGGLDLDAKLANTNEVTVARMGALTDWINGGRLDLLLDAIPTTAMRGTDGANTTVPDAAGVAPTAVEIRAEMDSNSAQFSAIVADTNELQTDWADAGRLDAILDAVLVDTGTTLPATLAALNNISTAEVNTEAADVLFTDTHAELASVPAANAPLADKINWLFMMARNKLTQTATTAIVKADDGSTTVGTSTVSDDATTATRGEFS